MPAYKQILAVLDLSAGSDQVVAAAVDMAAHTQAGITLLHVVEFLPVEPMGEPLLPTAEIEDELLERSRQKLTAMAAQRGLGTATLRVEAGNIKAEILRVAAEQAADLIVVGSHERHGLAILVNFTDDTVLHAAHCDVLAVRLR